MKITAIPTKKILFGEDLIPLLLNSLPSLQEKQVLVISSKILSLCYGYFIRKESLKISKESLIKKEADQYWQLSEKDAIQLTIKRNIVIPFAGIDESNGAGTYVLFPQKLFSHTADIWNALCKHYQLEEFGVLIADSQVTPLRRGTVGLGLSWCGFHPFYSYQGLKDCFDYTYQLTCLNLVDAYATSAVVEMGEGDEQTPIALIDDAPKIQFMDYPPNEWEQTSISIEQKEDLFYPLFSGIQSSSVRDFRKTIFLDDHELE